MESDDCNCFSLLQVVDLFESVRLNLASIVFFWSAQCGLTQDATTRLMQQLKKTQLSVDSGGGVDSVTLALTLALLYAFDLSILQRLEDTDPLVQEHPLLVEKNFIPTLLRELSSITGWASPGIGKAIFEMYHIYLYI